MLPSFALGDFTDFTLNDVSFFVSFFSFTLPLSLYHVILLQTWISFWFPFRCGPTEFIFVQHFRVMHTQINIHTPTDSILYLVNNVISFALELCGLESNTTAKKSTKFEIKKVVCSFCVCVVFLVCSLNYRYALCNYRQRPYLFFSLKSVYVHWFVYLVLIYLCSCAFFFSLSILLILFFLYSM